MMATSPNICPSAVVRLEEDDSASYVSAAGPPPVIVDVRL